MQPLQNICKSQMGAFGASLVTATSLGKQGKQTDAQGSPPHLPLLLLLPIRTAVLAAARLCEHPKTIQNDYRYRRRPSAPPHRQGAAARGVWTRHKDLGRLITRRQLFLPIGTHAHGQRKPVLRTFEAAPNSFFKQSEERFRYRPKTSFKNRRQVSAAIEAAAAA